MICLVTHSRFIPYRNCRENSEAFCGQYNQKVATQRDIQRIFQLLQRPVDWKDTFRTLKILKMLNVTGFHSCVSVLGYRLFFVSEMMFRGTVCIIILCFTYCNIYIYIYIYIRDVHVPRAVEVQKVI